MSENREDFAPLEPDQGSELPTSIDHRSYRSGSDQSVRAEGGHSEETKAYALAVYAESGSVETAAKTTGLPRSTIHSWVSRDTEIDSTLDALRRALRERMAWKYAEAAELALNELRDRLEHGDELIDKDGNSYRKKVPARELAFITSVCGDKHALLTGTMGKHRAEDQALSAMADRLVKAIETRAKRSKAADAS